MAEYLRLKQFEWVDCRPWTLISAASPFVNSWSNELTSFSFCSTIQVSQAVINDFPDLHLTTGQDHHINPAPGSIVYLRFSYRFRGRGWTVICSAIERWERFHCLFEAGPITWCPLGWKAVQKCRTRRSSKPGTTEILQNLVRDGDWKMPRMDRWTVGNSGCFSSCVWQGIASTNWWLRPLLAELISVFFYSSSKCGDRKRMLYRLTNWLASCYQTLPMKVCLECDLMLEVPWM